MDTNVNKYRALLTSVRLGSFSRAAEELGHTPSAVSRMVRDLERDWDVRLVERRPGGIVPTPESHELLRTAESICAGFDRLERQVSSMADREEGAVAIAAPSSVVSFALPGRCPGSFETIRALACPSPSAPMRAQLLRQGSVDFAFTPEPPEVPEVVAHPFWTDRLVVVMPHGHPLEACSEIPVDALVSEAFIADDETAPLLLDRLANVRMRFTASDMCGLLAMVEQGLGVSLMPMMVLGGNTFDLSVRPLQGAVKRSLYLAHRPAGALTAIGRAFLGHLMAEKDAGIDWRRT